MSLYLTLFFSTYIFGVAVALISEWIFNVCVADKLKMKKRSFLKSVALCAWTTYFHPVFLGISVIRAAIQEEVKTTVTDTEQ